ncbi:hypothetical protein [Pseudoalteromonas luteoviolacea]|uniref:Uncharacterized protein n=1 Tax=Pseudoalteromonas luteoviolacea S4060-1 TaxID=1365257 RepID=A0A167J1E0_9GAMM|nr:hypothetical protein [Pseudoalteromonas luteoviolacea]KZN60371.1 hypothetical protein N478_07380 [Pseudoalteromonas luteoviolacea S4060-1]
MIQLNKSELKKVHGGGGVDSPDLPERAQSQQIAWVVLKSK